ncbi:MAG: ribonuclease III [Chlorobiaceae bacterium]|nr:ribonuclease III [Chlorobiaceae bacterium]NTV26792.1 ribonuclease III [Chlorobiaceae bacterium]
MSHLWQKLTSLNFLRGENFGNSGDGHRNNSGNAPVLDPATTAWLETLTGRPCRRIMLYRTALTHRSVLHDLPQDSEHPESNQRLEFLGDAVLDLLISEHLFKMFPTSDEGHLSNNRSKIVNRKSLAAFALKLGLGEHLFIGDSADRQRIRTSESALADAFEAIIGAIYLDQGIAGAERFITNHVLARLDMNRVVEEEHNHKSRLIEFAQSHHLPAPAYCVVAEEGAEHEKTFTVEVSCKGVLLGRGRAARKKDAEQIAAREAMLLLETTNPFAPEQE